MNALKPLEITLHELIVPGDLMGKEVIDSEARRVGIIRGFKLKFPPLKVFIIVRGKNLETEIPIEAIEKVGQTVVNLKRHIELEEIDAEDVLFLLRELKRELLTEMKMGLAMEL